MCFSIEKVTIIPSPDPLQGGPQTKSQVRKNSKQSRKDVINEIKENEESTPISHKTRYQVVKIAMS